MQEQTRILPKVSWNQGGIPSVDSFYLATNFPFNFTAIARKPSALSAAIWEM